MGIDKNNLDLIDLINMMSGRWLRSMPQNTPIKGSGKGVGKGKLSTKPSNILDTSNENAQKSNKENPQTQKKGEQSEGKKKQNTFGVVERHISVDNS